MGEAQKAPLYIFDLDGTLADASHRIYYIQGKPKNWDAFFAACIDDRPLNHVIAAFQAHRFAGHRVEIWSGRSDQVRAETVAWLERHGIDSTHLTRMRRAGDYTQDHVLKMQWLAEQGEDRPVAVYDDRDRLVQAWREAGIPCFQVAPGEF